MRPVRPVRRMAHKQVEERMEGASALDLLEAISLKLKMMGDPAVRPQSAPSQG